MASRSPVSATTVVKAFNWSSLEGMVHLRCLGETSSLTRQRRTENHRRITEGRRLARAPVNEMPGIIGGGWVLAWPPTSQKAYSTGEQPMALVDEIRNEIAELIDSA